MKRYKIQVSRIVYAKNSTHAVALFIQSLIQGKDFIWAKELKTSKYKVK